MTTEQRAPEGAKLTSLRITCHEGGSITVQGRMTVPLPERRQQPACMSAEPLTADEVQKLFDEYVARCGGAAGSEQERELYVSSPSLAAFYRKRQRRDRRWLVVTLLIVVGACFAALSHSPWIAQ